MQTYLNQKYWQSKSTQCMLCMYNFSSVYVLVSIFQTEIKYVSLNPLKWPTSTSIGLCAKNHHSSLQTTSLANISSQTTKVLPHKTLKEWAIKILLFCGGSLHFVICQDCLHKSLKLSCLK